MKFQHVALSAAIGVGALTASVPSHAIIQGAAGEAYLIPLVIYSDERRPHRRPGRGEDRINTVIQITIPGSIGLETVPNDFTAFHVSPTNNPPTLTPVNQALGTKEGDYGNYIHWAFFDAQSKHVCNGSLPVSPNDFATINWGDLVDSGACNEDRDGLPVNGMKGYMLLVNENAYDTDGREGAEFAFFADAYLVTDRDTRDRDTRDGDRRSMGTDATKIPALPMADGPDATPCVPTPADSVCYDGDEINASPLISGMRTNASNNVPDQVYFDLTLSTRDEPTMHVFWMDRNGMAIKRTKVYDSHENECSGPTGGLYELNVWWITALDGSDGSVGKAPSWVDREIDACDPYTANDVSPVSYRYSTEDYPGFILYGMDEPVDTNVDAPESAGVAFAIQYNVEIGDEGPNVLPVETVFGHERGMFQE